MLGGLCQAFAAGSETNSAKLPFAVNADDLRVATNVSHAGATQIAGVIHNVAFGRNKIANPDLSDLRANFDHIAAKFVTDNHRWLDAVRRPRIPLVYMNVCSAD